MSLRLRKNQKYYPGTHVNLVEAKGEDARDARASSLRCCCSPNANFSVLFCTFPGKTCTDMATSTNPESQPCWLPLFIGTALNVDAIYFKEKKYRFCLRIYVDGIRLNVSFGCSADCGFKKLSCSLLM